MRKPRIIPRTDLRKKVRRPPARVDRRLKTPLRIPQVLAWAKEHFKRTGVWPNKKSGEVHDVPWQTWYSIEKALNQGGRGLPSGLTIVRLLTKHLGVRNKKRPPKLTIAQILEWADRHKARTGDWPHVVNAPVVGAPGENWKQIDLSLCQGRRGLRPGSSLAKLLYRRRGVRNANRPPRLTVARILRWADQHHVRNGAWPSRNSGEIPHSGGENWRLIDCDLQAGLRGLRRSTLQRLLHAHRAMPLLHSPRPLSERAILTWADEHKRRTGKWPAAKSGHVAAAAGESWGAIDAALGSGLRALAGGSSLARLLERERGVRNRNHPPPLSRATVLGWADAHRARTGRWPNEDSGPIPKSGGETWCAVFQAFRLGRRGLRRGSLSRVLKRRNGRHA